ncbi:hypothetical protein DAEQUDRAFT_676878 [Daedalea quercina L-15889]|uniref:Signal recognition particle subunit SRP72 n=1 Tax=Daedalea quercina L-15889 TaxID=1314783 RepID=A0A165MA94_9APHY|nr:hypothetical protein DAEQUDRAFT_676878 [Daedalea quercina L-15889]
MVPKPSTPQKGLKHSSASSHKQPKSTPTKKQPLSPSDRLKRLFTSLCAQIDGGYFANAIKTCDKILRIDLRDQDALQTKLFLLLQTEQYAAALTLISNANKQSGKDENDVFSFEKAYTLHRLHREDDATEVLKALKEEGDEEENRGFVHLEAQLSYRGGEYQTAYDLYNTLLDTAEPHSDEQADILTNLSAAQAHLDFLTSGYLTSLSELPQPLTDSLEFAPPPLAVVPSIPTAVAQGKDVPQSAVQQKKPRTRRIPKGVVPGATPPPDPERWLKKSERSSYLQAHARRRRGGGGATQGVVETPGTSSGAGSGGGASKGKKKGKK